MSSAEGAFELADAGMDVHPRMESVVEAGAVGLVVIDDGLPRREEALCGVVPFVVGVRLLNLGFVRARQTPELLEVVAAAFDLVEVVVDVRDGFGLALILLKDGVDLGELRGGQGAYRRVVA